MPLLENNFFSDFRRLAEERKKLLWEGQFSEYLEKVTRDPSIVTNAHETLLRATSAPDFFEKADDPIFGMEKSIRKWSEVLEAAAEGLSTRNRIVLLLGPPGGGKSTFVTALKRGLETYSKSPQGAIYAIADCPLREEPLHLIPKELRSTFEEQYGIKIEGDLCPHCSQKYGNADVESVGDVPIKRIFFSERDRLGIGTFSPSDPKSQDTSELTGEVDFSKLGEIGTGSDPRAFKFNGELPISNRGVMEFIEMLKVDQKFLYILLGLAQEGVIKVPHFANISVDEVVISHTNQAEYTIFTSEPKNEALKGRIIVIPFPYNLRLKAEMQIYEKLMNKRRTLDSLIQNRIAPFNVEPHVMSPGTLEVSATLSILSRLEESKRGVPKMKKLRLYNGDYVEGSSQRETEELQKEFPNEGMDGISPRYVIDTLALALMKNHHEGKPCLTPIDALRALRDGLNYHMDTRDLPQPKKDAIAAMIGEVTKEYDSKVKREVQAAFIFSFPEAAKTILNNYIEQIRAFTRNEKVLNPKSGNRDLGPDEKFMRSIEELAGISNDGKLAFRQEVMFRIADAALNGETFSIDTHPLLKRAIENKLFAESKSFIEKTISARIPDKEQQTRLTAVVERLMTEQGYCEHCANELLKYASALFAQ